MSHLPPVANRMTDIEPFRVMDLLQRARELEATGQNIIHMEIGEPDFATPEPILSAAKRQLEKRETKYTPALGLDSLKEEISRFTANHLHADIDPNQVVITSGASASLMLAMAAILDPGAEILMADPGYPCNRNFAHLFQGVPKAIAVDGETNYQLTLDLIKAHWGKASRAVLIASPANPTGSAIPFSELENIQRWLLERGGWLIVDEIYLALNFTATIQSASGLGENVIVVNSFSKYFAMTGWRLGWMTVPKRLLREIEKLAQNLYIAPPTLAQHAALSAFTEETLVITEGRREIFARRRDLVRERLGEMGFTLAAVPDGAFYLYLDSSQWGIDSLQLSTILLEKVGVALTPGLDFGRYQADSHLRLAYTTSESSLTEGVERIATYWSQNGPLT